MRPATRHSNEFSGILTHFLKGLNKSLPPHAIDAEELIDATNMYYAPDTGYLRTREGLKRHSVNNANDGIVGIYEYVKDGVPYVLCVSSETPQVLYLMDVNSRELTAVGPLTGTKRPSFSVVNGVCFIASGGKLQSFDGTTLQVASQTIGTDTPMLVDPPMLDFITDASERDASRVAGCGNTADRDRLFLSGTNDGTYWKSGATPETDAKYIDAGWKDGLELVGIGVYQGDAILFKRTPSGSHRAIYRGVIGGDSSTWTCTQYRRMHSTLSPHLIAEIERGLLFIDIEGPKIMSQTTNPLATAPYDISLAGKAVAGEIASKINTDGFIIMDPVRMVCMVKPTKNSERFYCMDFLQSRWTYFAYGVNIQSGAYVGGKMLFGASDGYVYEYDKSLSTDNEVAYKMTTETKWFDIFKLFDELVKEKYLDILGLQDGAGTIVIKQKGAVLFTADFDYSLGWWEWSVVNAIKPEDWTEDLKKSPMFEKEITEQVEGDFMSIAISITSGQCALSHFAARVAQTRRNTS